MKKIILAGALAGAALYGGSLHWEERVRVTESKPVYRTVTIRTPYEECTTRRIPVYRNDLDVPAAAIIGAVTGGVIGHQVGDGHGRDAATVGGAVVGALVGSNIAQQNRQVRYEEREVCETRYRRHKERRLVHYKNIAWYRGHRIVKRSKRPLKHITLSVDVTY